MPSFVVQSQYKSPGSNTLARFSELIASALGCNEKDVAVIWECFDSHTSHNLGRSIGKLYCRAIYPQINIKNCLKELHKLLCELTDQGSKNSLVFCIRLNPGEVHSSRGLWLGDDLFE